ncbi:hypothetical protein SOPP22_12035 [Shewanella sp. OPT22]|nr:hypothetical protein SOPP22_12035 [Shewanella sp. OPT22]
MEQLQKLLPGEDLFGLIGRSFVMSTFRNFNSMRKTMQLTHFRHLPGTLISQDFKKIIAALNMNSNQTHSEHTCFNMLKSSISPQKLEEHVSLSKNITFNCRGSVVSTPWRWCSDCVKEDTKNYGIPYYHRDHQIPGVFRCLKHQCTLVTQCYNCQYKVTSIEQKPLPLVDEVCPDCGSIFDRNYFLLSPKMIAVENICLEMAYGRLQIPQQKLAQRVQNYMGVCQHEIEMVGVKIAIRNFYLNIVDFYGIDELKKYFSTVTKISRGIHCPALKGSNMYDFRSIGKPNNPVAIALIWHFLDEMLDNQK